MSRHQRFLDSSTAQVQSDGDLDAVEEGGVVPGLLNDASVLAPQPPAPPPRFLGVMTGMPSHSAVSPYRSGRPGTRYRRAASVYLPSPLTTPLHTSWAKASFLLTQQEMQKDVQSSDISDALQFSSPERFSDKVLHSFEADVDKVQPGDVFVAVGLGDTASTSLYAVVKTDESSRMAWDAMMRDKTWNELLDAARHRRLHKAPTPAPLSPRGRVPDSTLDAYRLPHIGNAAEGERETHINESSGKNEGRIFTSLSGAASPKSVQVNSLLIAAADEEDQNPYSERFAYARSLFINRCKEKNLPELPYLSYCGGLDVDFPAIDISSQTLRGGYAIAISVALHSMAFLKYIDLTNTGLDKSNAQIVISSLASNPIEVIILDKNRIGKPGVQALSNLISKAPRFCLPSKEALQKNNVPEKEFNSSFADMFNNGSNLSDDSVSFNPGSVYCTIKTLSLKENSLGDQLMCKLLRNFVTCSYSHIKELCLRHNDLGIETIKLLCRMIRQQCDSPCQLELIDLSWNHIRDEGARLLLDAVSESKVIKVVNIEWNALTNTCISAINSCVRSAPSLELLTVRYNSISPLDLKRGLDAGVIAMKKIII